MRRTVHPSSIDGIVAAPPSKSAMIRVTAAALLADEDRTRITNPTLCEDARSAFRVATGLGATVTATPDEVVVEGRLNPGASELDCGESGLCLRMFTAIAALAGERLTVTGREALLRRPAAGVEEPLGALGAVCRSRDGYPPVTVHGPLRGGEATVDGSVSSQFLSGLLLALPLAEGDSVLNVRDLTSRPYVDLTLGLLDRFGVRVENENYDRFRIPGRQTLRIGEHRVEGDWSAAASLLVLGAVGGRLRVTGLDPESVQADRRILDALEKAGAGIVRHADGAEAARSDLRAFEFDLTDSPDLLLPLAALAVHCRGRSILRGVRRLVHKESDRVGAVADELSGLGVSVGVEDDLLTIEGGPVDGGRARSHGDHRIAMALAATAVAARGPVSIDGAEHVAKSYPDFFEDLAAAGGEVE